MKIYLLLIPLILWNIFLTYNIEYSEHPKKPILSSPQQGYIALLFSDINKSCIITFAVEEEPIAICPTSIFYSLGYEDDGEFIKRGFVIFKYNAINKYCNTVISFNKSNVICPRALFRPFNFKDI